MGWQSPDAARELLREILDGDRAAEAAQTNDVVRVFTLVTAVLLPLTVITGHFGMNFANLPGTGSGVGGGSDARASR